MRATFLPGILLLCTKARIAKWKGIWALMGTMR
jgi:hypothetical protein